MSAKQLREFAAPIAAQWKQLDDLEAAAAALDVLPANMEPARNRATIAASDWQAAQARSEAARRTFDNNFRVGMQRYAKDFGDFMQRWGLPRSGGEFRTFDRIQMAAFEQEGAAVEVRKIGLERGLTAEKGQVEALEATTKGKQTAAQYAGAELANLQAALSTRTAGFSRLLVSTEAGISGLSGPLTPFPNNVAKPTDLTPLVNRVPGPNTRALEQLPPNAEKKESFHGDCFQESGCSAGPQVNGGPAIAVPPGVAESLARNPAYQGAKAAHADAVQRRKDTDMKLREIQRDPKATREQLEGATAQASKAMGDELMKKFTLESFGAGSRTEIE